MMPWTGRVRMGTSKYSSEGWWKNSGLKLEYTEKAMDWASDSVHIQILDWWNNSGLKLRYTEYAMNWASAYGQVKVLVRRMVASFRIRTKIHPRCHKPSKCEWTYRSTRPKDGGSHPVSLISNTALKISNLIVNMSKNGGMIPDYL